MEYALDARLLPPGGVPVQCTRCSHVFTAAPPAQAIRQTTQVFGGGPVPAVAPLEPLPKPANPLNTTLLFGSGNKGGAAPSASTTQAFGAVPRVPPVAPVTHPSAKPAAHPAAHKPQPAQAGSPPSTMKTQVFGAVPKPAAHPPQAGGAPAPMTTQAFGAVPQPPRVGVAAATPIELPDEMPAPRPRSGAIGPAQLASLEEPPRPRSGSFGPTQLADIMAEESSAEGPSPSPGPSVAALSKPLELPPELLEERVTNDHARGRGGRSEKGLGGRALLIAAGVLVLALTAFLTSPAWLGKSNAVPHEAVVARDSALAVLRRDDTASKVEALSRLKALVDAHPASIELLAEWSTALAMHLDDTRVEGGTLKAKVARLKEQISALSEAQSPADWSSRVNAMREEVAAAEQELTPLEERGEGLSREAVRVLKRLAAAPEEEEKEAAVARLRARALLSAVLGASESLTQAVQLAQAGQRDWSELVVAEYVLNGTAAPAQAVESAAAMARLREANSSFLRTYVLGARIAVLRGELDAAQALLEAVITLNPKHELAQKLQAHARELALEKPEVSTPLP
jgi:outer membrane murein-binding lipoprotein Lpp